MNTIKDISNYVPYFMELESPVNLEEETLPDRITEN
jgi:hypothetical protein